MQPKRALSLLRTQEQGAQLFECYCPVVMSAGNPIALRGHRRDNRRGWNGIAGAKPQALRREAGLAFPIAGGDALRRFVAIA